jgi:hypothetical protein
LLYHQVVLKYGSDMTANFYGAGVGWIACFLTTIGVSFVTKNSPLTIPVNRPASVHTGPIGLPLPLLFSAAGILLVLVLLNFIFA